MTKQTRRKFSAEFKAKVSLEAIKNQKTLAQLSQQYQVNPITISKWKADAMENMSVIFKGSHSSAHEDSSVKMDKQYAQIETNSQREKGHGSCFSGRVLILGQKQSTWK